MLVNEQNPELIVQLIYAAYIYIYIYIYNEFSQIQTQLLGPLEVFMNKIYLKYIPLLTILSTPG